MASVARADDATSAARVGACGTSTPHELEARLIALLEALAVGDVDYAAAIAEDLLAEAEEAS
jgi:hypothetical protein